MHVTRTSLNFVNNFLSLSTVTQEESQCVALTGVKLPRILCFCVLSAVIIGMCHHTRPSL